MTKPTVQLFFRPLPNFESVKVGEEMGDRVKPKFGGGLSAHEGIDLIPSKGTSEQPTNSSPRN